MARAGHFAEKMLNSPLRAWFPVVAVAVLTAAKGEMCDSLLVKGEQPPFLFVHWSEPVSFVVEQTPRNVEMFNPCRV